MKSLMSKVWNDDQGAIISVEMILVIAIAVLGIIPGLVALRNTTIASLTTLGNTLMALQTGFSFAPIAVVGTTGGTTIALVLGASFSPPTLEFLRTANPGVGFVVTNVGVFVTPAP